MALPGVRPAPPGLPQPPGGASSGVGRAALPAPAGPGAGRTWPGPGRGGGGGRAGHVPPRSDAVWGATTAPVVTGRQITTVSPFMLSGRPDDPQGLQYSLRPQPGDRLAHRSVLDGRVRQPLPGPRPEHQAGRVRDVASPRGDLACRRLGGPDLRVKSAYCQRATTGCLGPTDRHQDRHLGVGHLQPRRTQGRVGSRCG